MKYRPEIDGLRALALLPVIFYHAGFAWFRGGFVGVDIFFVISGFLITSIIITAQTEGTFSLIEFYERRARRILPALLVVMLACWPFAWVWMFPYQMQDFSESLIAVSFFVSNIFFGSESGYFATGVEMKPLLHTWSLAIEEQYYLLFPLFVLLFWRLRKGWLMGLMILMGVFSFSMIEWDLTNKQIETFWGCGNCFIAGSAIDKTIEPFYLLWTRGWELLLGAIFAFSYMPKCDEKISRAIKELGSFVGVSLIGYAVLAFDDTILFPSHYTLIPTFGAICLITFATPNTIVGRMLGHRWLVAVGLISYSAYLWHYPLFAFARIRNLHETPEWIFGILSVCALCLGYVTWRFIELPFRDKKRISRSTLLVSVIGMSVVLVGLGLVGTAKKGFEGRFKTNELELMVSPKIRAQYVVNRYLGISEHETFMTSDKKKLAVIGDSFSQDFVNMAFEVGAFHEYDIRTHYIPAECQIYYGEEDISHFRAEKNRTICLHGKYWEKLKRLTQESDIIIFAAVWKKWAAERLPVTIHNLAIPPGKEVVVVGRKKFGKNRMRQYLTMTMAERRLVRNRVGKYQITVNDLMASLFPDDQFVNIHQIVCGARSPDCPVFTDEGKLISWDGSHLTEAGARFIGRKLFAESVLKKFK